MGVEKDSDFQKAICKELLTHRANKLTNWATPTYYISRGLYYCQVKRYLDKFVPDKCLILFFEELSGDSPNDSWCKINRFLGVNIPHSNEDIQSNVSRLHRHPNLIRLVRNSGLKDSIKSILPNKTYSRIRNRVVKLSAVKPSKLDQGIRQRIHDEYFASDVDALVELLGLDSNPWCDDQIE